MVKLFCNDSCRYCSVPCWWLIINSIQRAVRTKKIAVQVSQLAFHDSIKGNNLQSCASYKVKLVKALIIECIRKVRN